MNNDNIEQVSGQDSTEQGLNTHVNKRKLQSRRSALGGISKLTLGAWSLPIVTAVILPAHATMSVGMDDDDTTGEEETPPVLTLSNQSVNALFCFANSGVELTRSFEVTYDYESSEGAVSHSIVRDTSNCLAESLSLTDGNYEEGEEILQSANDLDTTSIFLSNESDEFGGSVTITENDVSNQMDETIACTLIITITDAGGNTASATVSIDECSEDDFFNND